MGKHVVALLYPGIGAENVGVLTHRGDHSEKNEKNGFIAYGSSMDMARTEI